MPLSNYEAPSEDITIGNNTIKVRGLNSNDLSVLIQSNLEAFESLFDVFNKILGEQKDPADGDVANALQTSFLTVARTFPTFSAALIARAEIDEADFADKLHGAEKLSFPIQIDILMVIGRLTFTEVGGVKKFFERFKDLRATVKAQTETKLKKKIQKAN